MTATTRAQRLCRIADSVHDAAGRVADVHEDLGPEAAAVAAALTLLSSPTTLGWLRQVTVTVVAEALAINDAVLNRAARFT